MSFARRMSENQAYFILGIALFPSGLGIRENEVAVRNAERPQPEHQKPLRGTLLPAGHE